MLHIFYRNFLVRVNVLFLILSICTALPLLADTWRVFFYMDSSDGLSDMAFKNITDMVRGKPNDSVEFFVQLHAYHKAGLRYQVTADGLKFIEEVTLAGDIQRDLIDAASWGFANNSADHTMLILSNHGFGILDPQWNDTTQKWEFEQDEMSAACTIKRSRLDHSRHKGYMFAKDSRSYLNNQLMIDTLQIITQTLVGNQLDVLAFDTCMGAMLENAYQLVPCARYLIGCQSCSLPDGFDYQGVMNALNHQNNTPRQVTHAMIHAFDSYYAAHDESGVYTYAALDLSYVMAVKEAFDACITQALMIPECASVLDQVRDACPRFCMFPMYTDAVEFCSILDNQLNALVPSEATTALHDVVHVLKKVSHEMIIARCGGYQTKGVCHGHALYCPFSHIDSTYYKTIFAQQSPWLTMLGMMCNETEQL